MTDETQDIPEALMGSSVQPAELAISADVTMPLGDVVRHAFAASSLTAAEWNALSEQDREDRIAASLAAMREAAATASAHADAQAAMGELDKTDEHSDEHSDENPPEEVQPIPESPDPKPQADAPAVASVSDSLDHPAALPAQTDEERLHAVRDRLSDLAVRIEAAALREGPRVLDMLELFVLDLE